MAASVGPYGAFLTGGSEYRGDYGVSASLLRRSITRGSRRWRTDDPISWPSRTLPTIIEEAEVLVGLLKAILGRKPGSRLRRADDAHTAAVNSDRRSRVGQ
ncbi:MAG: hypothetical protein U0V87_08180 [Acidobacteriota bacterium]